MTNIADMFEQFRHDAWRLEARDTYRVADEQERIQQFMRTGIAPRKTIENNSWMATIAAAQARGAHMGRVRLVGHPITPYTRFEFAAYCDNVAAGEDVRVVDRAWLDDSWQDAPDFWIFDSKTVFIQNYDHDGTYLGAELVHDARPYVELRERIAALAVPLVNYQLADIPAPRSGTTTPTPLPAGIRAGGNRS
jgi:hypothetical protein